MITRCVGELAYVASPLLDTPHGFSTRLGGVSTGHLASLNLGHRRGDREDNVRENYRRFCAATGTRAESLVMTNQVHGAEVRAVTERDAKADLLAPTPFEADGLTTDRPGLTLVIFSADCIPILFWDPVRRAVGACHAGWRGTAAAIAGVTARAMTERYGCRPEDLRCAIGPGIGPCCFLTDADVPRAMEAQLGELAVPFLERAGEKYRVDLKGIDRAVLLEAGVLPEHIDVSGDCTCCLPEKYWSHRFTKGVRGSQAACIMLEVEA